MTGNELVERADRDNNVGPFLQEVRNRIPVQYRELVETLLQAGLLFGYLQGRTDATLKATTFVLESTQDAVTVARQPQAAGGAAGVPAGDGDPDV